MKERMVRFLLFAILVFLPYRLYSQSGHELVIPDYSTNGHYLNDDIMADTTATGSRVDPDRVYVLKRNGLYLVNVHIRNTGWALRIKAEEGTGAKPVVYGFINTSTSKYPNQVFDVEGDLYLKKIAVVGWYDYSFDEISKMPPNVITVLAAGPSLYIDSCVLSGGKLAIIQTTSAARVVKVTNTIMAQSGNLYATNIGNGRPIDLRNASCDSLVVQNCSMTDYTDRTIRHYSSIGSIGYLLFDHNTVVNAMAMHGCLGLGMVGKVVQITNNVFVDNFALGNDSTDDVRLAEFGDPGELDQFGNNRMTFVGSVPNDSTQWIVRNNYYSVSPAIQSFYDSHANIGLGNLTPLTWNENAKLGADSVKAFTKDNITLTKPTRDLHLFAEWYWKSPPDGPGKQKASTGFDSTVDYQRPEVAYYSNKADFNLAYNTSAKAYTGADNGSPAGDLNWYPGITAVNKNDETIPVRFSLEQNYPNPFNPSTVIKYSLPKAQLVTLKVYNLLGQKVTSLVNEKQSSGDHEVTFNANKLASGIYFYELQSGNFIQTKKMLLLK